MIPKVMPEMILEKIFVLGGLQCLSPAKTLRRSTMSQEASPVRKNARGSISSLGASVNLKGESPKCAC